MAKMNEPSKFKGEEYILKGKITFAASGLPAVRYRVVAMDADLLFDDKLGQAETGSGGEYEIRYGTAQFRDLFERAPDIYLLVFDEKSVFVTDTRPSVVRNAGPAQEIHVQVPPRDGDIAAVAVGGTPVDRRLFATLEPEDLLKLAETAVLGPGNDSNDARLASLSPELDPKRLASELCFTPLVRFLRDTVSVKKWPREVSLRLEEILIGFNADAAYATHNCPNFDITYQTSGGDQPPPADTGGNITMPGTGTVVGTTAAGNGVPDYIEKLCFWLENALAIYTNPPFSLRNPAVGGKIPVTVTGTSAGFAGGGAMTIGRNLNDDLLAAVPTHELMHLMQELYQGAGTAGPWNNGMAEGGAVLGEDVVFDTHNRYIVQATNSGGTLASPATSLNASPARYFLALLLKYISEQQSSRINPADEPSIGVETYRALLERFDVDGYGDAAFEGAVGDLPWYQNFFRFGYLDPGRLDETSSETLLGNFWAACYLKDMGTPVMIDGVAERRFDFMEDEENTTWDGIFGAPAVTTLGSVALTSTNTLNAGGNITLSSGGSVSPFAARFYRVNVAAAVDTLRVDFTAGTGFTRPLVQILLVEPGNVVRDILRSDRTTWSRTIANARAGTSLDHILIIVAGTDVGGTCTLTTRTVAAAPDVMVTRWHHRAGRHFEIDSFGWAWTWASPDIWVDTNMDGVADDQVFFNTNNKLFIRLRNHGHADAAGISVQFWYQDASPGLSDAAWLPVQNDAGVPQSLSGLALAAGATNQWSVDWSPVPSGTSNHFCVRAVVTVPGDPNTDNKRCLNNFGNVVAGGPYWIDLSLLRRVGRRDEALRLDVIPRTNGRWFASAADMKRVRETRAEPGAEVTDVIRIRKRAKLEHVKGNAKITPAFLGKRPCPTLAGQSRRELRPNPFGHYPTDPRALPPGMERADLVTIAHVVDGKVLGGFTWAVREK